MPAEEEKKKKRKLVVEETSTPEPIVEAEIPEEEPATQPDSETSGQPENKAAEEESKPEKTDETETEEPVTPKEETPKKSILIPTDEKESESHTSSGEDQDSKVSTIWVVLLVLFIIASLVGGGILVFRAGVEKGKLEAGSTQEAAGTATPTPTPSSSTEVKREDLKIQVLNGTGKAGVAASAQSYLEGLGYKNVEVGNADSSDFTETAISIKDSKKEYLETLKGDLVGKYVVSAAALTLSSGSDFDAVVTIGTSTK